MAEFEYPKEPKFNGYFTADHFEKIKEKFSKEPIRLTPNNYDFSCYKSPITSYVEEIAEDAAKRQEDYLMAQVCLAIGYNIDKDELIKALQYDRHQYEAGYADGRTARDREIIRCRDCKYYRPAERLGMKLPPDCGYFSVGKYLDTDLSPDDFCSRAERRETE